MKEVNLCEVPGISDLNRTEIPISPVVGTPPQDHGLRSKFRGNIVHRDLINEGGQSLRGARYFLLKLLKIAFLCNRRWPSAAALRFRAHARWSDNRSEEHTSELQSLRHLV